MAVAFFLSSRLKSSMPPSFPLSPEQPLPPELGQALTSAVRQTPVAILLVDARAADHPIVFANPAFSHITGYGIEEVLGRNCRFLQGPLTDRAQLAKLHQAVHGGREISLELLNYRRDGSTFWNALTISPIFDEHGELTHFLGCQQDVSRRHALEESRRQVQKMEALGRLTGGLAHDFNNILQVLMANLDLLQMLTERQPERPEALARTVEACKAGVERAGMLTQQLLAFSRRYPLQPQPLDINALVQRLGAADAPQRGAGAPLQLDLQPELPAVRADPSQLELALQSLLSNAGEASSGLGERVLLRTRLIEQVEPMGELPPGACVEVAVVDHGRGMNEEVRRRATEPFFSTKPRNERAGLGLAMVYGFARQSGGALLIHSEEGRGSEIALRLPLASQAEVADAPAEAGPVDIPQQPRGRKVLLVEDRVELAHTSREILEYYGYRVHVAADAEAALEMLQQLNDIDLLFTDIMMPGPLDGHSLAHQARERWPGLKVLLTTGYADALAHQTLLRDSPFPVIHKPYAASQLLQEVAMVLEDLP